MYAKSSFIHIVADNRVAPNSCCYKSLISRSEFDSSIVHFVYLAVTDVGNFASGRPDFPPTKIWTCSGMKLKVAKARKHDKTANKTANKFFSNKLTHIVFY